MLREKKEMIYTEGETKRKAMMEKISKTYIPSPEHWKESYSRHKDCWSSLDKVPISKIKIDSRFFSYPNKVDLSEVNYIVNNFSEDAWSPILINEEFYLLDGQHRLMVAKFMKLKYIDVIIQHIENYSYYYGKPIRSIPEEGGI
jgi:hypothetical protein